LVNYNLYIFTLSNILFLVTIHKAIRVRRGRDRIIVAITTEGVSSNPAETRCTRYTIMW